MPALRTGFVTVDQNDGTIGFSVAAESAATVIYLQNQITGFVKGTDGAEVNYSQSTLNLINREPTGPVQVLTGSGAGLRLYLGPNGETGFFGSVGTTKATVTGAKGSNAALASLLTALSGYGLVTDSTSA